MLVLERALHKLCSSRHPMMSLTSRSCIYIIRRCSQTHRFSVWLTRTYLFCCFFVCMVSNDNPSHSLIYVVPHDGDVGKLGTKVLGNIGAPTPLKPPHSRCQGRPIDTDARGNVVHQMHQNVIGGWHVDVHLNKGTLNKLL